MLPLGLSYWFDDDDYLSFFDRIRNTRLSIQADICYMLQESFLRKYIPLETFEVWEYFIRIPTISGYFKFVIVPESDNSFVHFLADNVSSSTAIISDRGKLAGLDGVVYGVGDLFIDHERKLLRFDWDVHNNLYPFPKPAYIQDIMHIFEEAWYTCIIPRKFCPYSI